MFVRISSVILPFLFFPFLIVFNVTNLVVFYLFGIFFLLYISSVQVFFLILLLFSFFCFFCPFRSIFFLRVWNFSYFSKFFNNIYRNVIDCEKISKIYSNDVLLIDSDGILNNCNESCIRLDSDISVEEATNRVFLVGHKFILPDLKKLYNSFGWNWNFCTSRAGTSLRPVVG